MKSVSTPELITELVKRLEAEAPKSCNCCDELAGLPTDDDAMAFVAAMSMGGTGEFTPMQDHELDSEDERTGMDDSGSIELTYYEVGDTDVKVVGRFIGHDRELIRVTRICDAEDAAQMMDEIQHRIEAMIIGGELL